MHRDDLIRRAAVIFRDHGYTLKPGAAGTIHVAAHPAGWLAPGSPRYFASVTAAFDYYCPLIADDDFTARFVLLFRAAEVGWIS